MDLHSWGAIALGIFKQPKQSKLSTKFINLALILALKLITGSWKSKNAPRFRHWNTEFIHWAKAEYTLLFTDESKGLRKYPIASGWDALILQLQSHTKDDDLPP